MLWRREWWIIPGSCLWGVKCHQSLCCTYLRVFYNNTNWTPFPGEWVILPLWRWLSLKVPWPDPVCSSHWLLPRWCFHWFSTILVPSWWVYHSSRKIPAMAAIPKASVILSLLLVAWVCSSSRFLWAYHQFALHPLPRYLSFPCFAWRHSKVLSTFACLWVGSLRVSFLLLFVKGFSQWWCWWW